MSDYIQDSRDKFLQIKLNLEKAILSMNDERQIQEVKKLIQDVERNLQQWKPGGAFYVKPLDPDTPEK